MKVSAALVKYLTIFREGIMLVYDEINRFPSNSSNSHGSREPDLQTCHLQAPALILFTSCLFSVSSYFYLRKENEIYEAFHATCSWRTREMSFSNERGVI